MNRVVIMIRGVMMVLLILVNISLSQNPAEIKEAYQEAKLKCFTNKWTDAISLFEKFLEDYPENKYEDDAIFWMAYSMGKIPEQMIESFETYSRLVEKYPNSTWVDDAQVHQINLAEQFILGGQVEYKEFLYQQMSADQTEMQYKAAIALGRIGDKKALPVLKKMKDNEDYGNLAQDLIAVMTPYTNPVDNEAKRIKDQKKLDIIYNKDKEKTEKNKLAGMMLFDSERYAHYRSMLRNDDEWSKDELTNFALWHITSTDDFKEYSSLNDENEKKEWRRKYWKRKDPTPTTPENELEMAFQNRIKYARSHFATFWNYKSFMYMPDQHLRLGWPHAPWDARGELYIKYGAPEIRSMGGLHTEIWIYERYNVDFLVKQYMTNIYGNAIVAGELSYRNYGVSGGAIQNPAQTTPLSSAQRLTETLWTSINPYVQTNFIFNQEIRYSHQINADPIEGIENLLEQIAGNEKNHIIFRYKVPAAEFALISQTNGLELRYKEIYCILNEDLREVAKNERVRRVGNIPNDDFKFEESIQIDLPEGKYALHLRLEDQNADNIGMVSHEFEVK